MGLEATTRGLVAATPAGTALADGAGVRTGGCAWPTEAGVRAGGVVEEVAAARPWARVRGDAGLQGERLGRVVMAAVMVQRARVTWEVGGMVGLYGRVVYGGGGGPR